MKGVRRAMETKESEKVYDLTITWKIENISLCNIQNTSIGIFTSVLRLRTLGDKRLRLFFDPKDTGRFVSLCIFVWDESLDFPIDCEWSYVGGNGTTLVSGTELNCVLKAYTQFHLPRCPSYEEVFVTRRTEFLPNDTLTVRCRIRKSRSCPSIVEFISCRTRLESLEHSFLWPISGFSSLELNEELWNSVTFYDLESGERFLIKFSLMGISLKDSSVSVKLSPVRISSASVAAVKLTVMDKDQKAVKHAESKHFVFWPNAKESLVFPDFMSRKELLDNKYNCLRNDIFNLHCNITLIRFTSFFESSYYGFPNTKLDYSKDVSKLLNTSGPISLYESTVLPSSTLFNDSTLMNSSDASCCCSTSKTDVSLQKRYSLNCLTDDLRSLYSDQNFTDFTLLSGGVSFPVHKSILGARSPVFNAMFSNDMRESGSDSLDVPDLDAHTLNRMLTFLYTGNLEPGLKGQETAKLYYAADKYQIPSLMQECCCIFRSDMSVANVSDILILADRHQDKELTSYVHDFILSHFDEIMQSEEWERFMESDSALAGKTGLLLYKRKLQPKLS